MAIAVVLDIRGPLSSCRKGVVPPLGNMSCRFVVLVDDAKTSAVDGTVAFVDGAVLTADVVLKVVLAKCYNWGQYRSMH